MSKKTAGRTISPEEFKDYVLGLERENLRKIEKEPQSKMVSKIIKTCEDMVKNDN